MSTTIKQLSEEMLKRIRRMAWATYETISSDLEAVAGRLTLAGVVETVADADYMLTYGRDKDAYAAFQALSYAQQNKLLRELFRGQI